MRSVTIVGRPIPRSLAALVFAAALGIVLAAMVIRALDLGTAARTMPLVVGVPTLALVVGQIIRDGVRASRGDGTVGATSEMERDRYRQAASGAQAGDTATPAPVEEGRRTSMAGGLLWVAGLVLGVWLFGMILAIPIFMATFMRIFGRERWTTIVLFAVVTTVAVYLLFVVGLEVTLYPGQLGVELPRL